MIDRPNTPRRKHANSRCMPIAQLLIFSISLTLYLASKGNYSNECLSTTSSLVSLASMKKPWVIVGSNVAITSKNETGTVPNPVSLAPPPNSPLLSQSSLSPPPHASNLSCDNGCQLHGTCNLEIQECRCPRGYIGPTCSELAMPRCNLASGYSNPSCFLTTICSCFLDCERFNMPHPYMCHDDQAINGTVDTGKLFGLPLVRLYTDRKGNEVANRTALTPAEVNEDFFPKIENPFSCASNCSGIGGCLNGDCICPFGYFRTPKTCAVADTPFLCPNNCSGFGDCHGHFCKCHEGYFGVDCAVFIGEDKRPHLVDRSPYLWSSAAPKVTEAEAEAAHPKVYVYDLPGHFNIWLMGNSYLGSDYLMEVLFFERILSSSHRTANADEADFFYVPLFLRAMGDWNEQGILNAIEYISRTWPYYNKSDGADHLFVTSSDWGNCHIGFHGFGFKPLFKGITITTWGYTKNMDTVEGIEGRLACFRQGIDIAIPPVELMDHRYISWFKSAAFREEENKNRTWLLYYSGSRGENVPEKGWVTSNGVRQMFMDMFHGKDNETGFKLNSNVNVPFRDHQRKSIFCFAPCGFGWGMRQTQAVLMGCIPVVIQPDIVLAFDGDVVDWREFAVVLEKKDIPQLPRMLKTMSEDKAFLKRKRKAMEKVWMRFLWATPHVNPLKDLALPKNVTDDFARQLSEMDAATSVLQSLRKRKGGKGYVG